MLSALAFASIIAIVNAQTSEGCTTLIPDFGFPADGTSTVFASTVTPTSTVNCRGCFNIVRSTYAATVGSAVCILCPSSFSPSASGLIKAPSTLYPATPTATSINSDTPLTSFVYVCSPPSAPGPTIPFETVPPVPSSTSTPLPSPPAEAATLIDQFRTVIDYATMIANGNFAAVLCAGLNAPGLSNITGINGTAVQTEVCNAADVAMIAPVLYPFVVRENQAGVGLLYQALFAIQVTAGYGGSSGDSGALCASIEELTINNLFIGYIPGGGTRAKNYVCGAAGNGTVPRRRL